MTDDNKIKWAGRSAVWALTLGMTGLVSGFIGPLIFNPSNIGPLLGIIITGPLAFLAGGLLGANSAFKNYPPKTNIRAVIACSLIVMGLSLLGSMPGPRPIGFLIDAEIKDCKSPEAVVDASISNWEKTNWSESYQPRINWKADIPKMVKADKGVVLDVFVFRQKELNENRKPWNKGQREATNWHDVNAIRTYYARSADGSCADYTDRSRRIFFPVWEASTVSPPDILPTFLGLFVLQQVPQEYQGL